MKSIEGFEYNEHEVCMNPEIVIEFGTRKTIYYKITVAKNGKGWDYGFSYNCNSNLTNTGGSSVSPSTHSGLKTKNLAVMTAANFIKEAFNRYFKDVPQLRKRQSDLNLLNNFLLRKSEPKQLELFA